MFAQFYLTLLAVLALFALLMAGAFWLMRQVDSTHRDLVGSVAWQAREAIADSGSPREMQAALDAVAAQHPVALTLFGPRMAVVANVGVVLPPPPRRRAGRPGFRHRRGFGEVYYLPLGNRSVLAAHRPHSRLAGILVALVLLAVAVGIGAWPVARRLTRRLERLQQRVELLASGNLGARVKVEGRDEVAGLATAFNTAADRIEALVSNQRETLAVASHELRTPLARLRVATELLGDDAPGATRELIARDIDELDELIEEMLLVSRLRLAEELQEPEPVDLLALLAEECARFDATFDGVPCTVPGDPRLLRRLIRNLLANSRRHAPGAEISVQLECPYHEAQLGAGALLRVSDTGPGIEVEQRERVFEQFARGAAEGVRGVGLGLWLVRRVAERHGGWARHADGVAAGASFEVFLSG